MRRADRVSASEYLRHTAGGQQLYRKLFREAMRLLPLQSRQKAEVVACMTSQKDLAKEMKLSPSTIGKDMALLINNGWVEKRGPAVYFLGTRYGDRYALLADVVAEEQTGVACLIGNKVLRLIPSKSNKKAETGISRRWRE